MARPTIQQLTATLNAEVAAHQRTLVALEEARHNLFLASEDMQMLRAKIESIETRRRFENIAYRRRLKERGVLREPNGFVQRVKDYVAAHPDCGTLTIRADGAYDRNGNRVVHR